MSSILEAFILLLFIMDPVVSMMAFISLTKGRKPKQARKIAIKAVAVAAIVFLLFAFGGDFALKALGVELDTFRAAGGVILVVLGIQMALGLSFPKENHDISEAAVVIGTPLISGPAAITTTMLLTKDIGLLATVASGCVALAVILLCLLLSSRISRYAGRSSIRVLSTMMGIVTIAWGLQFLLSGVVGFLG
jgi:multiple antibiotic resistance protein